MENNKIVYLLTVGDIQTVANQEIERNLSYDEIKSIIETIAEKINWYDAIADSITEKFDFKATSYVYASGRIKVH
jgi:hypothetical protein